MRDSAVPQNEGRVADYSNHSSNTSSIICIEQVIKKNGKPTYELVFVPDTQGYENEKPLRSIGSSFDNVTPETNLLLDNNFNLQDLLASLSFTEDKKKVDQTITVEHLLSYIYIYISDTYIISIFSILEAQSGNGRD